MTHRDAMIAAARRARASRAALDKAPSQSTTAATLLDASGAMDLGLTLAPLSDSVLTVSAIEDIVAALRLAFDHLLTDMQAIARADAQLESALDQLDPLNDARSVFCGEAEPEPEPVAIAQPEPGPDEIAPPWGPPIPAGLSWTDGWVIDARATWTMPWIDDPAVATRENGGLVLRATDGGTVVMAGLGVPFGSTHCESASLSFPNFRFTGWFEAHCIVEGRIEIIGPRGPDNVWPIRISARVTQEAREDGGMAVRGTTTWDGEGTLRRGGNLSTNANMCAS